MLRLAAENPTWGIGACVVVDQHVKCDQKGVEICSHERFGNPSSIWLTDACSVQYRDTSDVVRLGLAAPDPSTCYPSGGGFTADSADGQIRVVPPPPLALLPAALLGTSRDRRVRVRRQRCREHRCW